MNDCIFCKIVSKEIPAHVVYEDEKVIAFLDRHPINPGHVLVIPRHHEPDFYRLEDSEYLPLMTAVKKIARTIEAGFGPRKVGLIVAGWDVPHTHVHVVPMNDYNDITSKSILEGTRANPTDEELSESSKKFK